MIEGLQPERLGTDLTRWTLGPFHGALPGAMRLSLQLDGEIVSHAEVESGFLHRGLEKALELHRWHAAVTYADHLDPEAAIHGELALCLAVERLAGIQIPERAQAIRVIVAELSRVSSHFAYMARMARAVGATTMMHYVLRDRERLLDLFELLTGGRFSINFLRFGGVSSDVTEGFVERVLEAREMIRIRLKEYNDLLSFNHAFLRRTRGIGVISREAALRHGATGPNLRASGESFDLRKWAPYSGYDRIDFDVPVVAEEGTEIPGDSHSRYLQRLREINQCLEILKQVTESMPQGPFEGPKVTPQFQVPMGEGYAAIEGARGQVGCHVFSDGGNQPQRISFRTPSTAHLRLVPEALRAQRVEDVPVILASLDLCLAEVDR